MQLKINERGRQSTDVVQLPSDHVLNDNLAGIMEQLGKYKGSMFIS